MVDCQIRPTKVTDDRVIDAFASIPREAFVGRNQRAIAYVDEDLPFWRAVYDKPMVLARMIQALSVHAGDNVLVVGGATGTRRHSGAAGKLGDCRGDPHADG